LFCPFSLARSLEVARYKIELTVEDHSIASVQSKLRKHFGAEASAISAKKIEHNQSRADRLAKAQAQAEEAKSEVEDLKSEMESWLENLPENLQGGSKAEEIQEAIDALDTLQSDLENCSWEINFPGMM
jgi:DNA repair exonuclease SbcCD ATPase subunit